MLNFVKILIIIIFLSPIDSKSQWWKENVFYQIYMPSFKDSNGDGYNDFKGITSKLDYVQGLGIKAIWLTPFLKSPKIDNGYDIENYFEIDSIYGNIDDFKIFLNEAHRRDIKVIIDMVLNHTSTQCKWFKESRKTKDNKYRNYYIWKDKPNNWESFFGGNAWQLDTTTNQFYYHKFDVGMADLNWTNAEVVDEVKNILRFWLNLGIDGFRFDVVNFLSTNSQMTDNPIKNGKQEHENDINQKGIVEAISNIKSTLNEYSDKFSVGEIGSNEIEVLKQYQSPNLMDVVFNFNFGSIPEFSVDSIFKELKSMEDNMPDYPTLFFGSHDMARSMNRLANRNIKKAKALAALLLTTKGIPFIYYGEEIGMQNIVAKSYDEIVDIQAKTHYNIALEEGKSKQEALIEANNYNRDKSRSPMQWDSSSFAGFSNNKSWIQIQENYKLSNVLVELNNQNSLLNTYKTLINIRNNEKTLQYGKYEKYDCDNNIIKFTRFFNGERISVVINFAEKPYNNKLPKNSKVLIGNLTLNENDFIIYKY